MNKYKIIAWILFILGIGIFLVPGGDKNELIERYPAVSDEMISKFYTHGYFDHIKQSLPALLLFMISMIILTLNKNQKSH
jgi:hypothetical protein